MTVTLNDEQAAVALRALEASREVAREADDDRLDDIVDAIDAIRLQLDPCDFCPGLRGGHKFSCAVGGVGGRSIPVRGRP